MERRRSPQRNKALDYQRQTRGFTEYAQSMRHGKWRKKKRRPAQKTERQSERVVLAAAGDAEMRDTGFDAQVTRRRHIGKWRPATLSEWVTSRKAGRAARTNRRASRRPR